MEPMICTLSIAVFSSKNQSFYVLYNRLKNAHKICFNVTKMTHFAVCSKQLFRQLPILLTS